MIVYFYAYLKTLRVNYLDTLFKIFNIILNQIVSFFYLYTIFNSIPKLQGWDYYDLLLIYSLFLIIKGFADLISNNIYSLERYIKRGKLDFYYVKPHSILAQLIFEKMDFSQIINIFTGILIFIYSNHILRYNIVLILVLLMIFIFLGCILIFSLKLIAMSLGFWTFSSYSIAITTNNILEYSKYPIDIYGSFLKKIFIYFIPMSVISYFLINVVKFNAINFFEIISSCIVCIMLFILSIVIWHKGLNTYQSGGH